MTARATDSASVQAWRAELQAVLASDLFSRAPTLASLLSYLCEKTFAGQQDQIKEYSVAVDVFSRGESFDQDADSIVRVQANRLRKRLADYYAGPGADHRIHISIPVGQYVPHFEDMPGALAPAVGPAAALPPAPPPQARWWRRRTWWIGAIAAAVLVLVALFLLLRRTQERATSGAAVSRPQVSAEMPVGLPVGEEVRILAGASRPYADRSGKTWQADLFFTGGTPVHSAGQHIWRTLDPEIYRNSRQGEFSYDIPLKPGVYELRLHFAENFYGPDNPGSGGEGSRVMAVRVNGKPLLTDFDVLADAGGSRVADVKVFTDIAPAQDGQLHIGVSSVHGGRAMLSAIEILPGVRGRMRPVRMVTRDTPYYSDDSRWWSADTYFKGGQIAMREDAVTATDDPGLYESERWGNFSYAIPVAPGEYVVTLHFIERRFGPGNRDKYIGPPPHEAGSAAGSRLFHVFCNGRAVLKDFDIFSEVGENKPLVRKITGLRPNAQGKLLLEFVPVRDYATVSALEVLPE